MKRDIPTCSGCGGIRDRHPQRYCRACHARWMRENRPAYSELPKAARIKSTSRAYANVYQRRGKLKPQPCDTCGARNAEKHHDDYSQPLQVRWKCRRCHLEHHREERLHMEPSGVTA